MICDRLSIQAEVKIASDCGKIAEYIIKIDAYVNGIKFDGYLEYWSLFEDTHLADRERYKKCNYTDYEYGEYGQFNRSRKKYDGIYSSVYFEMCSCGDPGCMGIYNGVRVYKKKKYFKYVAKKEDGYPKGIFNSGKWNLTFSKENIEIVRNKIADFFIQNEKALKRYYQDDIERAKEFKRTLRLV